MPDLKLIGVEISNFVRTARIACEEKGVPYELTADDIKAIEDLKSDVHLALHPFGKIPVMQHDGFTLFETSAICRYIDDTFDGRKLVPSERRQAALMEQWVSAYGDYIHPAIMRGHVAHYLFPKGPDGTPDRTAVEEGLPGVVSTLKILNGALEKGPFLLGATPTIADFFLVPAIDYLASTPEGHDLLSAAPNVRSFRTAFSGRPSYEATMPARLKQAA